MKYTIILGALAYFMLYIALFLRALPWHIQIGTDDRSFLFTRWTDYLNIMIKPSLRTIVRGLLPNSPSLFYIQFIITYKIKPIDPLNFQVLQSVFEHYEDMQVDVVSLDRDLQEFLTIVTEVYELPVSIYTTVQ
ncbi:hypothetical protein [Sphingobacterium athyrii]|nr:hypothetical protein [Sphingobacterium athyrii]